MIADKTRTRHPRIMCSWCERIVVGNALLHDIAVRT